MYKCTQVSNKETPTSTPTPAPTPQSNENLAQQNIIEYNNIKQKIKSIVNDYKSSCHKLLEDKTNYYVDYINSFIKKSGPAKKYIIYTNDIANSGLLLNNIFSIPELKYMTDRELNTSCFSNSTLLKRINSKLDLQGWNVLQISHNNLPHFDSEKTNLFTHIIKDNKDTSSRHAFIISSDNSINLDIVDYYCYQYNSRVTYN